MDISEPLSLMVLTLQMTHGEACMEPPACLSPFLLVCQSGHEAIRNEKERHSRRRVPVSGLRPRKFIIPKRLH